MAVVFDGIKTHVLRNKPQTLIYEGSPCLYHKHSTKNGTASTWRDSATHACLECLDELSPNSVGLDSTRISSKQRSKAINFWSHVSIKDVESCWRWTKPPTARMKFLFTWERRSIRNNFKHCPAFPMMWTSWGDLGRIGTTSLCGNRRCVNPFHNPPRDLLPDYSIDQLDIARINNEIELLNEQLREYHLPKVSLEDQKQESRLISKLNVDNLSYHLRLIEDAIDPVRDENILGELIDSTYEQMIKGHHPLFSNLDENEFVAELGERRGRKTSSERAVMIMRSMQKDLNV